MKQNWTYKKLGEVCETTSGGTPSKDHNEYYEGGTIPWLRSGEVANRNITRTEMFITQKGVDNSSAKLIPQNSVVIAMYGATVGQVGILRIEATTNQAVCSITPNDSFVPEFLYYTLLSHKKAYLELAVGGAQPNISQQIIKNTTIPLPPLETQSRIVSELDLLQSLIDKQKAQLKEYDTLAQSIFYDMFGDPVENEKGWEVKKLGEECSDMKYGTSRPACENGQYPYLRMCNISYDGYLDLNNLKTIDIPKDEIDKCLVKYGDILFNRTNSIELIGKTCMFDLETPMIIAGYIIRVRLSNKLEPRFISRMFNLPSIKKLLREMAKGAVNQANINSKELASIDIPVPPLSLQQSFAAKIESIEKQKAAISKSIAETEKLFEYTMDKYFG